ncbi:uncharacterized protein LOC111325928 [Stylophora pistillata]|uniref:uncharacterized protein LOC111325928 n=1 Tax=Stylophora pistillata TaxID=50429 RepID=UPI000C03FE11|nr:uncharacterized protein LOC111325928 [Stylophora pistillata]
MSRENKMGREKSFDIGKTDFSLDKPIEEYRSKQSQAFSSGEESSRRSKSIDVGRAHFSLDKPIEMFDSKHSQASGSTQATAEATFSSPKLLTRQCSWIQEEENCEEKPSSFSGLESYTPQLVQLTRNRPPRSRTRRPTKNVTASTDTGEITTQFPGLKAPEPSVKGKKPLRNINTNYH